MAKIDTSGWKEFRVGDLFEIEPTKGVNTYGICDDGDVPYIAASRENNGCSRYVSCPDEWVSRGNCLVFIHIGDAAAGVCHYVNADFVGMKGKTSCAYNDHINEAIGLFLASVITANNTSRYSFSQSWTGKSLLDTEILLPATPSGNPDWAYMESFMTEVLKESEACLENLKLADEKKTAVDISGWKEFSLSGLGFVNYHGQRLNKSQRIDGNIPFITAGFENRGIGQYIGNNRPVYDKSITVDMFGNSFFQPMPCAGDDNVYFFVNDDINDYEKLFISSCIHSVTSKKYAYVQQFRQPDADALTVELPVDFNGNPDWAYMDSYMGAVMQDAESSIEMLSKSLV